MLIRQVILDPAQGKILVRIRDTSGILYTIAEVAKDGLITIKVPEWVEEKQNVDSIKYTFTFPNENQPEKEDVS